MGEVNSSSAIPLLQHSDWSRELCVLEEPPLNHNSLGRRWTHYQIAGSSGERRHTHWMSRFTGSPSTTTQSTVSIYIQSKYRHLDNLERHLGNKQKRWIIMLNDNHNNLAWTTIITIRYFLEISFYVSSELLHSQIKRTTACMIYLTSSSFLMYYVYYRN